MDPPDPLIWMESASTQNIDDVRVTAYVPGRDEAASIFGVPLYDNGMQPVWIQVDNGSSNRLRFAPVGTDRFYYSPLEVAWKHRRGFSKEGKARMEETFHDLAMSRYIPPGETRSGFIFTHTRPGAKAFNIDLFGTGKMYDFTFLLTVPGFVPDYANIDFNTIYNTADIRDLSETSLRDALGEIDCCAASERGDQAGNPVNIVLIGEGQDLLHALLRANWIETSSKDAANAEAVYFFDRVQDAIFRYHGTTKQGSYELRLWLAPLMSQGQRVWMGQVKYIIDHRWTNPRPDPDVDNARNFLLQNMWYSQSLARYASITGDAVVPVETHWLDFKGSKYFTDGVRQVLWLSDQPVSLKEVVNVSWDSVPADKQK